MEPVAVAPSWAAPPAARALALWSTPVLSLAATVTGLVLLAVEGALPAASDEAWVLTVLPAWTAGGAALLWHAPGHRLGQLLVLVGAASSAAVLSKGWATHALQPDAALAGGVAAAWVSSWAWVLTAVPLVALLPLLLPDGRLPSRAWRVAAATAAACIVLLLAANMLSPGELSEWPGVRNPVGLPRLATDALAVAGAVGALLVPACALAGVAGLITRWRRSAGTARESLRLVALSAVPLAAGVVWSTAAPSAAATAAVVLSVLVLSGCVATAALSRRLFDIDIDIAVSRTVVWSTVAGLLLALHVGIVAVLDAVAGGPLLATALVAVLFAPLRDLAQRQVNAFLFGRRDDPWTALAKAGRTVEAAGRPGAALDEVVEVLAESLRLSSVQVLLADGGVDLPAAARGVPPELAGDRWREQPLVHLGERVGALRVAPRPGEALGRRDLALLAELAPAVSVVAAGVLAADRLRRAQHELLTAVEEERRRLRRELHDGVGPTLTGVAFALEAARNLAADGPVEVVGLLDTTASDLQSALRDLRHAVEGLRPPALDDRGLGGALRDRLAVLVAAGVDVDLQGADDLPSLPAAVEVAAYRIVLEGVSNVVRHARARRCDVRLSLHADVLDVRVRDDGCGPPQPLRLGTGLVSVRERAEALGGRAQLVPADGGSLLHVTLQVAP